MTFILLKRFPSPVSISPRDSLGLIRRLAERLRGPAANIANLPLSELRAFMVEHDLKSLDELLAHAERFAKGAAVVKDAVNRLSELNKPPAEAQAVPASSSV